MICIVSYFRLVENKWFKPSISQVSQIIVILKKDSRILKLDHDLSSIGQEFPPTPVLSSTTENCYMYEIKHFFLLLIAIFLHFWIYKSIFVLLYIMDICISSFKKFFGKDWRNRSVCADLPKDLSPIFSTHVRWSKTTSFRWSDIFGL